MITKGQNVIGLKIISIADGKQIDTIKDIIYDPQQNRVRALLIDEGGWFSDAKILFLEDVRSIGEDAVMVESPDIIKKASEVTGKVSSILQGSNYLTKTNVITEGGAELGSISDIFFDTASGTVEEFEVSQGLVQNVKSGKKRFRIDDIVTVGEQATIVRNFAEVKAEEQAAQQGVQGAMNTGMDKAKSAFDTVKEKAGELAQTAKEKASDLADTAKDKAEQAKDKAQDFANSPQVQDRKDQVQGALGSVTQQAGEKFNQAKESVQSGQAGEMVKEKASDLKGKAGDAMQNAGDKASQLKDSAQNKGEELASGAQTAASGAGQNMQQMGQQSMGQSMNDPRKQQALGKYVTMDIMTPENLLIAAKGERVSEPLINVAEAQGMLDILLNNTSATPVQ